MSETEIYPSPASMSIDVDESPLGCCLFEGDDGDLPAAARQVLVAVMKNYAITRESRWWNPLMEHRDVVKRQLNNMFLDLQVDEQIGAAYKVQVRDDAGQFNPLLKQTSFTREQTILLVFLRRHRDLALAAGEQRVFIDRSECFDAVSQYRPTTATDLKADKGRVETAIRSLESMGVVESQGKDRLEIKPLIVSLLPLGRLKELLDWLESGNGAQRPEIDEVEEGEDD